MRPSLGFPLPLLLLLGTSCCASPHAVTVAARTADGFQAPMARRAAVDGNGNACPIDSPWPCKNGACLSFAFICDGREDCLDGYDEDKALCTAKDRPPTIVLKFFIIRFKSWLIPYVLGKGNPGELAKLLTEERTVSDYAAKVGLSHEQKDNLVRTLEYLRDGRVLDLIMDGMPEEAYREAHNLLGKIVDSGFLGTV